MTPLLVQLLAFPLAFAMEGCDPPAVAAGGPEVEEASVPAAGTPPDSVPALLAHPAMAGWVTVETAHLRFHFPPDSVVTDRASFMEERERTVVGLEEFFGGALPGPVDFFVWNRSADAEPVLGQPLGFAVPESLVVFSMAGQTPGHELAHVVGRHAVQSEHRFRFIEEGTAVALDGSNRDFLALAQEAVARTGARSISILALWERGDAPWELLYPVSGAFVSYLLEEGGRESFIALLGDQRVERAREVYGAGFDVLVAAFEAELVAGEILPTIEALRTRARARMEEDRATFSPAELEKIERLYQGADRGTEKGRARLARVVEDYAGSNRAGCALLYLARSAEGPEREALLRQAIANSSDCWYGDGTQVGAYARATLAVDLLRAGRLEEARAFADEVHASYPGAVDHRGTRLSDGLRAHGL